MAPGPRLGTQVKRNAHDIAFSVGPVSTDAADIMFDTTQKVVQDRPPMVAAFARSVVEQAEPVAEDVAELREAQERETRGGEALGCPSAAAPPMATQRSCHRAKCTCQECKARLSEERRVREVQRKALEKERRRVKRQKRAEKKEKKRRRKRNALETLKKSLLAKGRRQQAARIDDILQRLPRGEEVMVTRLRKRARRAAAFQKKKVSKASTLIVRGLENGRSGDSVHQSPDGRGTTNVEGQDMMASVSFAGGGLEESVLPTAVRDESGPAPGAEMLEAARSTCIGKGELGGSVYTIDEGSGPTGGAPRGSMNENGPTTAHSGLGAAPHNSAARGGLGERTLTTAQTGSLVTQVRGDLADERTSLSTHPSMTPPPGAVSLQAGCLSLADGARPVVLYEGAVRLEVPPFLPTGRLPQFLSMLHPKYVAARIRLNGMLVKGKDCRLLHMSAKGYEGSIQVFWPLRGGMRTIDDMPSDKVVLNAPSDLRNLLQEKVPDQVGVLTDAHVENLWNEGYRSVAALKRPTWDTLRSLGLPSALCDGTSISQR